MVPPDAGCAGEARGGRGLRGELHHSKSTNGVSPHMFSWVYLRKRSGDCGLVGFGDAPFAHCSVEALLEDGFCVVYAAEAAFPYYAGNGHL